MRVEDLVDRGWVRSAVIQGVDVLGALVEAGRDPQLKLGIERVVLHRVGRLSPHRSVRAVDLLAYREPLLLGAEHGDHEER